MQSSTKLITRRGDSPSDDQQGFTIVELMIATAVLSVILLLVTILIIGIGRLYTKGINLSRIQDNTRAIVDDVSQHMQLSTQGDFFGPIDTGPGTPQEYCIGSTRYTVVIGEQQTASQHVLWRDNNPDAGTGTCPTAAASIPDMTAPNLASLDPSGTELVAARSRLTAFSITEEVSSATVNTPGLYDIQIGLAYGDDDQLCDTHSGGNSCTNPASTLSIGTPAGGVLCKGQTGEEFCGTSYITVSVAQRLTASN